MNPNQTQADKPNRFRSIRKRQWVRFAVATLFYTLFIVWVGNYWWLLGIPVIADMYLTRFIPWGFWRRSKNARFRKTMEWVDAILYALIAVYFINTFFFQNYKIPSSSLEKSLLVGDYLFVSKMSYGPRIPNTPLSFPLAQHTFPVVETKSYLDWIQWPYKRMKGFGSVQRNDIVVFNFPAGDTVAVRVPNPDYHTLVYLNGAETVRQNPAVFGEVVYRPVDRRENFVKRAVGMPGDTLQIIDNQLFINGEPAENPEHLQFNYYIRTNGGRFTEEQFRTLGVSVDDRETVTGPDGKPLYKMPLTPDAYRKLSRFPFVEEVIAEPGEAGGPVYPLGRNDWTRADYGPLWIPAKGATIRLTPETLPAYERVIRDYEGNRLETKSDGIYVNGKKTDRYTFEMDYYFMMGDNRDNSADSRSWGFVPEDHVVGKPLFVWLSLDKDRGWLDGRIRFDRLFKCVSDL